MEKNSSTEKGEMVEEPLLLHNSETQKGGLRTLPFILGIITPFSLCILFLNKACIVRDPQLDLNPDGEATDPWRLCTVDQVEELKALLKVVPIWLTGVVVAINISQPSFPVLQANTMDRHIGSSCEVPAASFGIFGFISTVLWIVLYDCLILPVASKLTGKPVHFSPKERMGFGLFLSLL
ncbi:Protein NRT1/ PTR FAMILY 1.2 [Capsicum chinense]|nr:Protein NRT1/ PTR FAMILY 1.2 [Capsicum chinense]